MTLPANTTFASVDTAGVTCTTPAVGGTGVVTCTTPDIPAGTDFTLALTVATNPALTAGATISHGTYRVMSNQESYLVGPLVVTTIVAGDRDGDGLSDAEEATLGTAPTTTTATTTASPTRRPSRATPPIPTATA